MDKENVYCRNCGSKLKPKSDKCPKCNTIVSNKRVPLDDGYIVYLILNFAAIILSFTVNNFSRYILITIAYIILAGAFHKYYKNQKVKTIFFIESILIAGIIILYALYVVSCIVRF